MTIPGLAAIIKVSASAAGARAGEADLCCGYCNRCSETPGSPGVAWLKDKPNSSQRSFGVFFDRRLDATPCSLKVPTLTGALDNLTSDGRIYCNSFEREWLVADDSDAAALSDTRLLRGCRGRIRSTGSILSAAHKVQFEPPWLDCMRVIRAEPPRFCRRLCRLFEL